MRPTVILGGLLAVAVMVGTATAPWNANAASTNAPVGAVASKAVFEVVRDPFFPKSSRGVVRPVSSTNATQTVSDVLLNQLVLKGISGTAERRVALINNMDFGKGEEREVRVGVGKVVKVRCLDILENSVVITVEGSKDQKELKLRPGS